MDKALEQLMSVTGALQSILDRGLVPEPQATEVRIRIEEASDFVNEQFVRTPNGVL